MAAANICPKFIKMNIDIYVNCEKFCERWDLFQIAGTNKAPRHGFSSGDTNECTDNTYFILALGKEI